MSRSGSRRQAEPDFQLGANLALTRLERADAAELLALIDHDRARLRMWLPWVDRTSDLAGAEAYIAASQRERRRGRSIRLGIRLSDTLIGIVALQEINLRHRSASIGYWIDSRYEGRGIVSACVAELCRYAIEALRIGRIELAAAVDNQRSRAVAERLGFRFEGILRCREWLYDHFVDHAVYSLAAGDPLPRSLLITRGSR